MLLKTSLLFVFGIALTNTQCRNRKQGVTLAGEPAKVNVSMFNLDESHKGNKGLLYRFRCDPGEWTQGKMNGDVVEFMVIGAKEGSTCNIEVFEAAPVPNIRYLKEPGLLYAAPVLLSSTAKGQLVGAAALSSQFDFIKQGYTIIVPVHFAEAMAKDPHELRARLICEPGVGVPSEPMQNIDGTRFTGDFRFQSGFFVGKKYDCKTVQLQRDVNPVYLGTIDPRSQAVLVRKDGDEVRLAVTELKAINVIASPGDVGAVIQGLGSCKDDEIFDLSSRTCIKRKP